MEKITIQEAINWIEGNLDQVSLEKISTFIGYSEFHTSRAFKQYTNSTLRNYIRLRRLSEAAKDLRDKNVRIIDCAFNHGFHSQEAFTKSFKSTFGITPGEYQKTSKALPLVLKKDILFPDNLRKEGSIIMVKDEEIKIKLIEIPEHIFYYYEKSGVDNYIDFWKKMEQGGYDCDRLHGIFSSIPGEFEEGFGAFTESGYIFGKDAPIDYTLDEKDILMKKIKKQTYLQFEHPGFTEAEFGEALNQVRRVALEKFDFKLHGYEVDDSFVKAYEHSGMEICFYFIRIPIKKAE